MNDVLYAVERTGQSATETLQFIGGLTCFEALVLCAHLDTSTAPTGRIGPISQAVLQTVEGRPMLDPVERRRNRDWSR